jgi:alginate O-acetyltransferase complex protein AlgI
MLFNSISYLLFLPIVVILYWIINLYAEKFKNLFLVIASLFFYGLWSYKFLSILIICILLDYFLGHLIARKRSKLYLLISILCNIGLLVYFKYSNFFIHELTEFLGLDTSQKFNAINIIAPIGISFYSFHGLSYVFDIYRGKQEPTKNIIDYALFVSFFPLLVAGPIERANHLIPQIQSKKRFNYTQSKEGIYLIIVGLFKKMFIADSLAEYVTSTFDAYQGYTALSLILAAVGFSFQVYADFSGYSDIAIGSAKLLGFELLSNFKFPYFAKNIKEYWQRWHISLSSWFRDYVYFPLGGSKGSSTKTIRNIFIIFSISGFWHGANWTFIFWGLTHAFIYLIYTLLFEKIEVKSTLAVKIISILFTFSIITFTLIIFRSKTLLDAYKYLRALFANLYDCPEKIFNGQGLQNMEVIYYISLMIIIDFATRKNERKIHVPMIKYSLFIMIFCIIYKFITMNESQFIYFDF